MTFVAQPYERFVDDLLLSLTGGVTREEHRYAGRDRPYSLAIPGAYAPSARVYGQRAEAFAAFEQGLDYEFDAEVTAITWKPDGRSPDEGSYFYISYDLLDTRRRLTDRNPGSVTTTLAESFGRELAVLHRQMEEIYRSAFVDLASGSSLDHLASLLGLIRRDAKFASGEVLFQRATPAPGDIAIPTGTLVSTVDGASFETTDLRTLRRDHLSVVAPIRAVREGPTGKVAPGAITQINRPLFGLEGVVNERATAFATERESDDELRRRLKGTLERAGKSTVDAIRYALIEELPEVTEANVQVLERAEAPGFVDVRLGLGSDVDADLVRRVEDSIFRARPAGVRVTHNLPTGTPTDSALRAAAERAVPRGAVAAVRLPAELVDRQPEGSLRLRVQALLRLTERNLTIAQKERIIDDLRARLVAYVDALPMGSDLVYAKLVALAVEPAEISDAILLVGPAPEAETLPTGDAGGAAELNAGRLPADLEVAFANRGWPTDGIQVVRRGPGWDLDAGAVAGNLRVEVLSGRLLVSRGMYRTNLSTHDRKSQLAAADVDVGLMDEPVEIDVRVLLVPAPGGDASAAPAVPPATKTALEDAVNRLLVDATGRLLRTDLTAAIREGLVRVAETGLVLAENAPVSLSAEYVETGRLLSDTEEVALEANHLARLRTIDVTIPGAFDVAR